MSLHLATAYADRLGLKHIIVTPDPDDSRAVFVDADRPLTPGALSVLRNRVWMAVLDHKRATGEPAAVLEHPWELRKTPTGAWLILHDPAECRMTSRGAA